MRTCTPVKILELSVHPRLLLGLSVHPRLLLGLSVHPRLLLGLSVQHGLKEKRQSLPKRQLYKLAQRPTSKLFSLTDPTFHVTVE